VTSINNDVPGPWRLGVANTAQSGASVAEYGTYQYDCTLPNTSGPCGETPGSDAWGKSGQVKRMRDELRARSGSWNVVSVTGGANDAQFEPVLTEYYLGHIVSTFGEDWGRPWAEFDPPRCPDTNQVYNAAVSRKDQISGALTGIFRMAKQVSPGVRIVDTLYPYVMNNADDYNRCWANHDGGKGAKATVNYIDGLHTAIVAPNVVRLDLRTVFGNFPIAGPSNTMLQLERHFGYPHVSDVGQNRMAAKAALKLGRS